METLYAWLAQTIGYTHPVHPPLTYIPLGMVIGALVFGLWAFLTRSGKYALTARHCITLAFLGVFPTILLGYMDWQHYYGGAWIFAIQMKIVLAVLLTVLLLAALLMHLKMRPGAFPILFIYLLAFCNIVALGYYGGELVFGARFTDGPGGQAAAGEAEPRQEVTFADVNPILQQKCVTCHQGADAPQHLRLTTYEEVMEGSQDGPVVIPGQPEASLLVKRIKGTVKPRMPLSLPPLAREQIRTVENWIAAGAPAP